MGRGQHGPRSPDDKGVARSGGERFLDTQFKIVAEAFLESFELLEEYKRPRTPPSHSYQLKAG